MQVFCGYIACYSLSVLDLAFGDYFVLSLVCAFAVLDLVSSVLLCQEIGYEERLQNDLFASSGTSNLHLINQPG